MPEVCNTGSTGRHCETWKLLLVSNSSSHFAIQSLCRLKSWDIWSVRCFLHNNLVSQTCGLISNKQYLAHNRSQPSTKLCTKLAKASLSSLLLGQNKVLLNASHGMFPCPQIHYQVSFIRRYNVGLGLRI